MRTRLFVSVALALALGAAALLVAARAWKGDHAAARHEDVRPNVLLISLDTTRPDHLGCYGYHRDTSPNLERIAAE
jgi:glucan phosphoethanolaminetransferase (alkaline phosphatase superfamily)